MKVLVLSDIHANYTALEAVLGQAKDFEAVWCLGDIVGYGPDPNECVSRIRNLPNLSCLLGNHDTAVIGNMDLNEFNNDAKQAVQWIQSILSGENLDFMRGLPEQIIHGEVTLSHGSPRNPVWEYILDWHVAMDNFDHFETPFCFVGHTHLPVIFQVTEEESGTHLQILNPINPVQLSGRVIANPGSVGQPRDRDARASYALYDTKTRIWSPFRVGYDVAAVQERIHTAGLPERNALRLKDGW